MRRVVPILVISFGAIALAFWPKGNSGDPTSLPAPITTENRILKLQKQIADQEVESAQAVADYRPKILARIDDLDNSVADLLRQLAGVVQVEAGIQVQKPTCRIVHLRDWHFVPKDLYAIDMKCASGKEMTAEEIDWLQQKLLLEVELVQLEQMVVLRCLITHHGLKRIYAEGLTANDLPNYKEKIAVLKDMEHSEISELQKQLGDVREMMKGREPKTDRYEKAKKIESEITGMIDQHKVQLLELGAPGRLLIAGKIEEVLPLDEADALEKAKPVTASGMRLDPENLMARQDAQVKVVMEKSGFGMIVLGGAHDLSKSVDRLGQGRCEYIRVTTRRFKEFSE